MMRVLCVEDDADSREMLAILLNQAGHELIAVSSAAEGLSLALLERFDLIILDNWLSMVSGVDLCKEIRRFNSRTPILFLSGAGYDSDVQKALEAGAQAYLIKPLGLDDLVQTAENLCHISSQASKFVN